MKPKPRQDRVLAHAEWVPANVTGLTPRFLNECCYQIPLMVATPDFDEALALRDALQPYFRGVAAHTVNVHAGRRPAFEVRLYFETLEDALMFKINPLAMKIYRAHNGVGEFVLICPPGQ